MSDDTRDLMKSEDQVVIQIRADMAALAARLGRQLGLDQSRWTEVKLTYGYGKRNGVPTDTMAISRFEVIQKDIG